MSIKLEKYGKMKKKVSYFKICIIQKGTTLWSKPWSPHLHRHLCSEQGQKSRNTAWEPEVYFIFIQVVNILLLIYSMEVALWKPGLINNLTMRVFWAHRIAFSYDI